MRQILCLLGLHKRSRGAANTDGPRITSICRRCGAPMTKIDGRWQVDRDRERPGRA